MRFSIIYILKGYSATFGMNVYVTLWTTITSSIEVENWASCEKSPGRYLSCPWLTIETDISFTGSTDNKTEYYNITKMT